MRAAPAKILPLRPRRSVPAKPEPPFVGGDDLPRQHKLTAQIERFAVIAHELPPLFLRHWQEIGTDHRSVPLDPDWERYMALDASGNLIVFTARIGQTLAGYIFNIVGPHLHYRSTPHAEIEMFWLDPVYRGGFFPVRWFRGNDTMLRELGVMRVHVAVKNHFMAGRAGSIFRRLGYLPKETVWMK